MMHGHTYIKEYKCFMLFLNVKKFKLVTFCGAENLLHVAMWSHHYPTAQEMELLSTMALIIVVCPHIFV